MDTLTHAFIPFAIFALMQRPIRERAAAAVGGLAPDLDGVFAWMSHLHPNLYFLVHRGASHTPWGGLVLAVGLYALLQMRWLQARWPKFRAFQWAKGLGEEAALFFGVMVHLILDALTISGVPALWPFEAGRVSMNFFFFSIPWLLPVSGFLLWRRWRGRLSDRGLKVGLGVIVAFVVVVGGVRAWSYPNDVAPDAIVEPTPNDTRWSVATPYFVGDQAGFLVAVWERGEPQRTSLVLGNAPPEARSAAEAVFAHGDYVAWRWDSSGAIVVNATRLAGAWELEFIDAVRVAAPWRGAPAPLRKLFGAADSSDWSEGALRAVVEDGGRVVDVERPRGFMFG